MNVISTLHSYAESLHRRRCNLLRPCAVWASNTKWNVAPFYATCSGLRSKIELLVLNTFKKKYQLTLDGSIITAMCWNRNRNLSSEHATNLNNCKGGQQIENGSSNINTSSTNTTSVFFFWYGLLVGALWRSSHFQREGALYWRPDQRSDNISRPRAA
jgi:hypothetical protein